VSVMTRENGQWYFKVVRNVMLNDGTKESQRNDPGPFASLLQRLRFLPEEARIDLGLNPAAVPLAGKCFSLCEAVTSRLSANRRLASYPIKEE
jgi:hypothetical protein